MDPAPATTPAPAAPVSDLLTAWPRSAQQATALFLALTALLLIRHTFGYLPSGTRPATLATQTRSGEVLSQPEPSTYLTTSGETPGKKAVLTSRPLNPNYASVAELNQLPGIGPVLAARIVATRQKAPFGSAEDLRQVPGIGPKTLEKIRPYLTFERAAVATVN